MSKERARRREVREAEAAVLRARRQRQRQRDARRRGRQTAILRWLTPSTTGRQTGVLAQRRRTRLNLVLAFLLLVQVVVWVVRPDWPARLTALIIAALAFPVLAAFTL